jgi:hypothetical protein
LPATLKPSGKSMGFLTGWARMILAGCSSVPG